MRIAYYLNDGTRKIGTIAEFRQDYENERVDPKRQAALEVKSDFHSVVAARALAHEELRDGEREERKWDDRRQLAYRFLRVVAVGLLVAAPTMMLNDPRHRPLRETPEIVYLFLLGVAVWLFATLVKTSVNLSRLCRIGRFSVLARQKLYELQKGRALELSSEEKRELVDRMMYPWKYKERTRKRK